ncbi:hypothetical protein SLEP1_g37782 [Rubroshorea leprosula]|uniref:Uncharacterized protein n=1 Tax=Rubroshorea leprosula TaxID=152421 RepID=A0AAV5KVT6_9ROSI|nr:hypothetical protein SLEP1_g37782 [Rubroshorea leprosula]
MKVSFVVVEDWEIELGDTLDLESSLRLSCKAPRLVLGVDTPMLKSAIVRATSYGARVRAEFEVDFRYLSELNPGNYCGARAEGTNSSPTELVVLQSNRGSWMLGAAPGVRGRASWAATKYATSDWQHASSHDL